MTEVPPPTRRARKDAPAPAEVRPGEGAVRAGAEPLSVSDAPPPVPGSAAAAAEARGSAGMPIPSHLDAGGSGAGSGAAFVDDPERMPTAQLEMAAFGDHLIPYVPPAPPAPRSLAPWALTLAIVALLAALFTGWLLPLGVVAAVFSVLSLRRPHDSRGVAGWALALAVLSLAFSVGWLVWGFSQLAVV